MVIFILPSSIGSAHSELLKANPVPNSQNDPTLSEIRLTFGERLENGLYGILVLDTNGIAVTDEKAKLSPDGKEIFLKLKLLPEGLYTTTYRVISADGHPIRGSYTFTIGQAPNKVIEDQDSTAEVHDHANSSSGNNYFFYSARILYYVSLLAVIGLLIWSNVWKLNDQGATRLRRLWIHYILLTLLISFLVSMLYHVEAVFQEEDTFKDLIQLL